MTISHRCFALFTGLALASGFAPAATAEAMESETVRVLHCARLLDVVNQDVLKDQAILVTGNRITSIGPAKKTPVPEGAESIDLGAQTCLPGLIDSHTHLVDRADGSDYNWAGPLMTSGA